MVLVNSQQTGCAKVVINATSHPCDLRHLCHSPDHHRHDDLEHLSSHDLDHPGFGSDRGLACHNHVDRLFEENIRGGGVVRESVLHDEANGDHLDRGHDQSQSAKKQREEYEPTVSNEYTDTSGQADQLTSIFRRSSRPRRLLCIS